MVARIVKDNYPGSTVARPPEWSRPFIFCSPHSGRDYPRKLLTLSPLPLETLRRSEDGYVDHLIPDVAREFVPVLEAKFPRLFVDVNRSPRELDPDLFSGPLEDAADSKSTRVAAGFGVIPKLAADGRNIYRNRLQTSEAKARLKHCYRPYHGHLTELVEEGRRLFGEITVIDWHSMPSTAGGNNSLADIVLGDLHGTACSEAAQNLWEDAFAAEGFTTARNRPYAGGYVASHYGNPEAGVSVLQIEINRGLYMDERRVARGRHFARFAERIAFVVERALMAYAPAAAAAE